MSGLLIKELPKDLHQKLKAALAIVGAASIDLILGALFVISFWKTSERAVHLQSSGAALPTA